MGAKIICVREKHGDIERQTDRGREIEREKLKTLETHPQTLGGSKETGRKEIRIKRIQAKRKSRYFFIIDEEEYIYRSSLIHQDCG